VARCARLAVPPCTLASQGSWILVSLVQYRQLKGWGGGETLRIHWTAGERCSSVTKRADLRTVAGTPTVSVTELVLGHEVSVKEWHTATVSARDGRPRTGERPHPNARFIGCCSLQDNLHCTPSLFLCTLRAFPIRPSSPSSTKPPVLFFLYLSG
jgi:hypothetical protein